jgi:hypothetical protein
MKRRVAFSLIMLLALAPVSGADTLEVPQYTTPCDEVRPIVGTVVAVSGPASSVLPGCPAVALGCGSAIYAGDHVTTGPGTSLGLQVGRSYAQVAGDSTVVASGGGAGGAQLAVESGQVRVVDGGEDDDEDGAPVRVVAAGQSATVPQDGDLVASAPAGAAPSICSLAGPLAGVDACLPEVGAGAGPGAGGVAGGISIADVARCTQVADLAPTDVAAAPPGTGFPLGPPPIPPPPYCQGGTCGHTPKPPPPTPPLPPCGPCASGAITEQPAGFEPPP